MKLFLNALIKFICGVVLVGLLLFLPAGTFNFLNAWIFIGVLFALALTQMNKVVQFLYFQF